MIDYRILPKQRLIVVVPSGATTSREIMSMSERLQSDPEFSGGYDAIVDNTLLEHPPTGQELRELADPRGSVASPGARLAVIAPTNATYGASRMHQILAESRYPLEIQIFRDRSSALGWLGIEGVDVEGVLDEMERRGQRTEG